MSQRSINRSVFVSVTFTLLFVSSVATAADTFVIVSDVDDTVKITGVRHAARALISALHSELVFAGMPELYAQMLGPGSDGERLRFISGSSRLLDHKITEALSDSKFPAYSLSLRSIWQSLSSVRRYKTERLSALYATSQAKFILIGDDTEADPEVYADFVVAKPGQVRAIYIRRVTGRQLPKGSIPFVTAYEIAVNERQEGRLSEDQVVAVGNAVLASLDRTLLPAFQVCPGKFNSAVEHQDSLQEQIQQRLSKLCTDRAINHTSSP
ncbi:MAG: hypothetical protein DMF56_11925 [Acidobacteria bacterium]|nr:MAG: hypothetical protein DMF56_11925 [Acidobacteriota bacterium]